MHTCHFSAVTAALLLSASTVFAFDLQAAKGLAQSFGSGTDKTDIMADGAEYSFAKDGEDAGWTTFVGNVAMRYKGFELRADKVRYNTETGDAEALGNVALIGEDGTLWKGDTLAINLKERAGRAEHIDLYSKPFRVLADDGSIDAGNKKNQTYEVENVMLTTCSNELDHLHYSVKARRARIRPGNDITAWGVTPRLFGVPFFYIPYYWKDLLNHYGFRFQPGYKGSWGAYLLSTYKFPIYRNREDKEWIDSYTFADYRSKRGWGFGERIQWLFGDPEESSGYVTGWFMPDDDKLPEDIFPLDTKERYRVRFEHSWKATDRDQVLINALYVSDTRIQKDFFKKEYRRMNVPDNYATFTHYGEAFTAGLDARFRLNDFYAEVERLPEAWFQLNSLDIADSGLYLDNETSLGFLRRRFAETAATDAENAAIEALNYEAFRADTDFVLSYPAKFFRFLSVVPRAGLRLTYYDKTRQEVDSGIPTLSTNALGVVESTPGKTVVEGDSELRELMEIGMEVSTRAYGFWRADDGSSWRHVAEPYADWTFVPEPNLTPDEIYNFDKIDRLTKEHSLRLGYRQRWQHKNLDNKAREIFYLDLYGDLNLDPEEEEESLSDFCWDTRYYPSSWLTLRFRGEYDNNAERMENVEWTLSSSHEVFRCALQYLFTEDENSLFTGSATWYPNERWGFNLYGRYEFETSQVEEIGVWLQHNWDCIAMRLTVGIEPGYTNDAGVKEDDDWSISITGWLTDFVPNSILEEDNR